MWKIYGRVDIYCTTTKGQNALSKGPFYTGLGIWLSHATATVKQVRLVRTGLATRVQSVIGSIHIHFWQVIYLLNREEEVVWRRLVEDDSAVTQCFSLIWKLPN